MTCEDVQSADNIHIVGAMPQPAEPVRIKVSGHVGLGSFGRSGAMAAVLSPKAEQPSTLPLSGWVLSLFGSSLAFVMPSGLRKRVSRMNPSAVGGREISLTIILIKINFHLNLLLLYVLQV